MTSSTTKIIAAFAAVYVIWGSTYLAIRYCVETMPPFLMAGVRFMLAGAVLYVAGRAMGARKPDRRQVWDCAVVGALLVVASNGLVVWAAQRLPSSITALTIAMAPLWFTLLAWWLRGERPTGQGVTGVLVGLSGVALLAAGKPAHGAQAIEAGPFVALVVASLSWAAGSVLAKGMDLPKSPLISSGVELLAGGALALVVGGALGEHRGLELARISTVSWISFAYLVVFGSLVGFTAYSYLIGAVSPQRLSTYAYVNPVVALILAVTVGGERLSVETLRAAGVILCGVVLMSTAKRRAPELAIAMDSGENAPRGVRMQACRS